MTNPSIFLYFPTKVQKIIVTQLDFDNYLRLDLKFHDFVGGLLNYWVVFVSYNWTCFIPLFVYLLDVNILRNDFNKSRIDLRGNVCLGLIEYPYFCP